MTNPYLHIIYDYCCMMIEDNDEHGEWPLDINLGLKDKIPLDEYNNLRLSLQELLNNEYDDFDISIIEDGICVVDGICVEDNWPAIDNVTTINNTEEKEVVFDVYLYDIDKNLGVIKKNNLVLDMNTKPPCIIGKLVNDDIIPLDEDDLIIASTLPFPII